MEKLCRRRKKKTKENKAMREKMIDTWVTDLISDPRLYREKPVAWSQPPQLGMDKIRAKSDFGKFFVDFASSSTIHGLNHLAAPHRHPFERFLALQFIIGAVIALVLLSVSSWERYQNDATIFVLDHDYRNLLLVKPSILTCPAIIVNDKMFPEVFQRHGIKDTKEARDFFSFIGNVTYHNMEETPLYDAVTPDKWLDILYELKPNVVSENPEDSSKGVWVVTERGFCLMFFSFVSIYTSYDYWKENNWTVLKTPKYPAFSFNERELVREVKILTDSFQVNTHYPMEIPEYEKESLFAPLRKISNIEMEAQIVSTSDAVKALSPSQRKCKKPEEDGLMMWPIYTSLMCTLECKYSLIKKKCGCHPHFARPMPGIPTCTAKQLHCVGQNRKDYSKVNTTTLRKCGCLPNCDTIDYFEKSLEPTNLKAGSPTDAVVKVHVQFPKDVIRRELLFGFNDFLAAVGGAAGLFLGASVISLVEVLYYLSLRLFWYEITVRRQGKVKSLNIKQPSIKENVIQKY